MTEKELLIRLASEAAELKDAIEVAESHEFGDHEDIREIVVGIVAVVEIVNELAEIEPRINLLP